MAYKLEGLQKEIWEKKYKYEKDNTIEDTWRRVAKAISSVETDKESWETKFYDLLYDFKFIPGGRITAGANTPNNYLLNCAVIPIEDSVDGIYEAIKKAAVMAKCNYGVGFDFSSLRPKNDVVSKGGQASGPVSFMRVFDSSGAIIETGGCFSGDTKINTDKGLIPIKDLVGGKEARVLTHKGFKNITARFNNGEQELYEVVTRTGYSVKATANHKFKMFSADGELKDILLKDLVVGDRIPILSNPNLEIGQVNTFKTSFYYDKLPGCTTLNEDVRLPKYMTEDLAYFLGFMYGNGSMYADKLISLSVSNRYPEVVSKLQRISKELFDLEAIVKDGDGACKNVFIYSSYLVEYLRLNGLSKQKALDIKVPECLFTETKTNIASFIAGYFDADGHNPKIKTYKTITSISKEFLNDIQTLLLQLGVFCSVVLYREAIGNWKPLYKLTVPGGVIGERFYNALCDYSYRLKLNRISNTSSMFIYRKFTPNSLGVRDKHYRGICRGEFPFSITSMSRIEAASDLPVLENLSFVAEDEIMSITKLGVECTYDLEVEDLHILSGNGIYTSNSRRAAQIAVLRVDHPDIFEFIEAKRQEGVLTQFNISVGITQKFLDAVKADEDFDLVFKGKVYQTVKAREIWKKLVVSAWNYNDPGLLMIDEVNKFNNGSYMYEIGATNPCFTGDMKLLTKDGYKTFLELEGKEFEVQAIDGTFSPSKVWASGVKSTVKVNFRNGDYASITCTPDHIFKLSDDSDCQAKDLKGKRVKIYIKVKDSFDRIPFMAGFIQGDGGTGRLDSENHKGLEVHIGAKDLDVAKLINAEVKGRVWYSTEAKDLAEKYNLSSNSLPTRDLPKYEWQSLDELTNFLSGLWSANGSVITNHRVAFKTTNKVLALELKELLAAKLGIDSYITTNKPTKVTFNNGEYVCKESYDLNIHKYSSLVKFAENISFAQEYKRVSLTNLLELKAPKVSSVANNGEAKVYDFTEPKHHWGVVEGVVVHNCGEIPLPDYGVCCLGNINLTKFIKEPFKKVDNWLTNFNSSEYLEAIRTAVRFLDNVLDVSEYPYQELADRARGDRRIGLNVVSGIGSFLAMLRIPYDSPEAKQIAEELQRRGMNEAYLESSKIAVEKGNFPNWSKDFAGANFLKNLDKDVFEFVKINCRNVALGTIPPAGTGSLIAGNISNGLEPIFCTEYNRKVRQSNGELKTEPVEDYAWKLWKQTSEYKQGEVPEFFKTSREISAKAHIDVQAALQKYIDGSISKTVNMPESTTLKEYEDVLWYSIEQGCKGFTSFREGTREGVLSSKDEGKKKDSHKEDTIKAKEPKKKRPRFLDGKTYKIADDKGNLYITINDIEERGKRRPFEIFINSNGENSEYQHWYKALGKIMSAVMRRTDDCAFLIKDLQSIFGVNGYFSDGRFVQSQPQMIGNILEEHYRSLNPEAAKEIKYTKCPECGEMTYMKEGGCGKCLSCGFSACG